MSATDYSTELVKLIRLESERLKEYVIGLSPEGLARPSPCARWSVGDVIAHLIWHTGVYGGEVERGLHGDLSPTEGFPADPGSLGGPEINQLYGDSAIELRRSLGDALISEFCHRYDWLNDLLKRIGPDDWEKPCYHFAMTRPVEGFIPIMLSELAVHGWDIRSNIEHTPSVSKACLPALIKKLPSNRYPWSLPFESEFVAEPKCLRFQFTDTGERLDVVVEECKVTMQPSGDGLADLSLTSDSNTYVLLMYGRRTLASFLSEGLFAAEGDLRIISDIDRWLAGC